VRLKGSNSNIKITIIWDEMLCRVNHLQAIPNYQLQITNLSSMYHSGCGENWITQDAESGFTLPEDTSGHDAPHS